MVDDSFRHAIVNPARKRIVGSVRAKALISALLPLTVLVLVIVSSLFLQSRERTERNTDRAISLVNSTSAAVLVDALNGETSVRGYALTGDAVFLQPYSFALSHRLKDELALRTAVIASDTHAPIRTILTLVAAKFSELNQVRELAASGATRAQLLGPLKVGKITMDKLRSQIARLETFENAKELVRKGQIATLEDQVTAGELAGLFLSIVGCVLGAVYFSRKITRRLKAAVRNARHLGRGEPLVFADSSGDEFDDMDAALKTAELQLLVSSKEASTSLDAMTSALERSRHAEEVMKIAESQRVIAEEGRLAAEVDREKVESQLHQSQRLESLGQLAGGVAHDFNNLLAVIMNYASFVGEELATSASLTLDQKWDGTIEDVHQIQVAAERASQLTHQLLSFARREVVQPRELDLNDAIARMEQILRRAIGEHMELVFDLCDEDAIVIADPGQIEQVVLNLAINARDAMPAGGTLSVKTSMRTITSDEEDLVGVPTGLYVSARVSDNGTGMPEEVRDRAFEPFFTTKPKGEGSGLGLATVYGIVKQAGGQTKIYSDEGVGTTITILLPAVDHESASATVDSATSANESLEGTETILVVDDEEALGEVARRILVRSGYTVLAASSGMQAIELASTYAGTIDLLLTDVVMPVMQGPAVAREVRKLRPDVKLLYMSGHALPVLEAERMLGTKFLLVEKPFDRKTLLKSVRRVLDNVG